MNKLQQLREMTVVVADTGDLAAIAEYKPQDATTNPSLLLKVAQDANYAEFIDKAVASANGDLVDAVDNFGVDIGCDILKIIPGRVSTEVDARLSFDTQATIDKAHKLIALYEQRGITKDRILIKIASTWEGIKAAEVLESEGINCNLTLMFTTVQAVAAAEAGAFLISPFVGRILDWHKKANNVESYPAAAEDPGVLSVRNIYNLYKDRGFNTVVMGASFRNVGEIQALAGCDRLTIGPQFLEELQNTNDPLEMKLNANQIDTYQNCQLADEADFRLKFNNDAMGVEKLAEGIRLFIADQIKLEEILKAKL